MALFLLFPPGGVGMKGLPLRCGSLRRLACGRQPHGYRVAVGEAFGNLRQVAARCARRDEARLQLLSVHDPHLTLAGLVRGRRGCRDLQFAQQFGVGHETQRLWSGWPARDPSPA